MFINTCTLCNCADKPNAPMNVRIIGNNTSESFVVQWGEVMDIFSINYIVRWSGEDGSSGMDTVDGLSYTATGLTPDTSYNITVAGNSTCCGAGPVSNIIMTSTALGPSTTGNAVHVTYVTGLAKRHLIHTSTISSLRICNSTYV